MDLQNLQTASHYLNNLLLARGLLRDAIPLDFANPGAAKGGLETTMAQIIRLVHDLVLRRDRETETLSALSQNLIALRTATVQQTQTAARLEDHTAELDRQLASARAHERSAQAAAAAAEKRARTLREDAARLKASVAQVRSQCAHDVRRRDTEIRRLQKHLDARQRGGREAAAPQGVTIVTPASFAKSKSGGGSAGDGGAAGHVESPEYSLRDETTEFLTQLSTALSDENDALIALARRTIGALADLQGLPLPSATAAATSSHASSTATDSHHQQQHSADASSLLSTDPNITSAAPPSITLLDSQTADLLAHLQELLTDPGFVRVEEVHAREAEIARLHHGWDAVESRWREAVALMRGWRERLADGSDTLRIEDLGAGLELGEEAVRRAVGERERFGNSPVRGEEIVGMRQARRSGSSVANSSMLSAEEEQRGEEQAQDASGLYPEDQERSAKEARVLRDDTASPARQKSQVELDVDLGIALLPTPAALRPIASNARRSSPRAQRQVAWRENSPIAGAFLDALGNSDEDDGPDVDEIAMLDGASEVKENSPDQPLSVQQKLDAVRAEAETARRKSQERKRAAPIADAAPAATTKGGLQQRGKVAVTKRTAISKRVGGRSKRRSTLSPEELEGLMAR